MTIVPPVVRERHWTMLAVFLLALLLFQMGGRGLNEPDEGRYANIAQEALEPGHSWLEPTMTGLGHYDKPPLIYGVTALSLHVFGLNEWAVRIPSFLGALLTLLGLGWAATRLYDSRIAWLAVLVAGTLLQIWTMARTLTPDMLLTGWCTLAVAAWVETRFRGAQIRWWFMQALFWTLALWTKATPALVPLLGLALYVYLAGDTLARKALKLPILLPLILLLGAPWFIFVWQRHPELKDFFLHRELAGRLSGHIAGRREPIYYYCLTSLIAWLPWWPLALVAFLRRRKNVSENLAHWKMSAGPDLFILILGFIVFSLIPSKLHTYTLPLAPWIALVMARSLLLEGTLLRRSIIVPILSATTILYAAISLMAPRYESRLASNSSVKEVAQFLRQHEAGGLHSDRLWPGLVFYWPQNVHFTGVVPPVEIRSDAKNSILHFEPSPQVHAGDWFIHYRKQSENPFRSWTDNPNAQKWIIGDFEVGPLSP
jgi:4-amino-4-deoxy-L-arabinose transferase-like glycosyltransferase